MFFPANELALLDPAALYQCYYCYCTEETKHNKSKHATINQKTLQQKINKLQPGLDGL